MISENDLKVLSNYNLQSEEEQRSCLYGMLLGDTGKCSKNRILIGHGVKQEKYARFKGLMLEKITQGQTSYSYVSNYDGAYFQIHVYPSGCELLSECIETFYENGCHNNTRKLITKDILSKLTLQGIALWYMDDGSYSIKRDKYGCKHGANLTINTYIPLEQNNLMVDYFHEKWDISCYNNYSKGRYRLGMGKKEGIKFFNLIRPFVIESMLYKLEPEGEVAYGRGTS